jgi:DNA-binding MarR family transcriptional regulator
MTRRMDASLRKANGMSLREYEVLLALLDAPQGRLRRVDLAAKVLLTQGGVTRLLEPLERQGLVTRAEWEADRRVVLAELTGEGRRRLLAARRTHRRDIETLFAQHFDAGELETLDRWFARLPGAEDERDWAA